MDLPLPADQHSLPIIEYRRVEHEPPVSFQDSRTDVAPVPFRLLRQHPAKRPRNRLRTFPQFLSSAGRQRRCVGELRQQDQIRIPFAKLIDPLCVHPQVILCRRRMGRPAAHRPHADIPRSRHLPFTQPYLIKPHLPPGRVAQQQPHLSSVAVIRRQERVFTDQPPPLPPKASHRILGALFLGPFAAPPDHVRRQLQSQIIDPHAAQHHAQLVRLSRHCRYPLTPGPEAVFVPIPVDLQTPPLPQKLGSQTRHRCPGRPTIPVAGNRTEQIVRRFHCRLLYGIILSHLDHR